MDWLAYLERVESGVEEQFFPAVQRSEVPRSRIRKIIAEPGPRAVTPAVFIWEIAAGDDGVQGLDDQRATARQQVGNSADHALDRLFANQRKVRDDDIDCDVELTSGDLFVGRDAKVAAAGAGRLLDESGNDIDARRADAVFGEG